MNNRLFAIGDIHGCFDSLKELVKNKIQLQKNDKLILLGDYIDRGNKSKEVIDFIIELLEKGYDVIPLMGNHEAMLLDAYENEKNTPNWIQNTLNFLKT
jgi:serine/threonine protein phosphatase 1